MKNLISILLLFISLSALAQNRDWTIKTSKDNKTKVKYDITKVDGGTHLYYIASRKVNVSLNALDSYFSNSENHKNFLENTPESKQIKKINNNEWITYYYFDAPWPMPNSDVVVKFIKEQNDNSIMYTATAITGVYEDKDVDRLTTYKFIYNFEKIDENTTNITINANFISVGSVPKFLVRTWFPEGPARIITNLGSKKLTSH